MFVCRFPLSLFILLSSPLPFPLSFSPSILSQSLLSSQVANWLYDLGLPPPVCLKYVKVFEEEEIYSLSQVLLLSFAVLRVFLLLSFFLSFIISRPSRQQHPLNSTTQEELFPEHLRPTVARLLKVSLPLCLSFLSVSHSHRFCEFPTLVIWPSLQTW